MSVVQAIEKIVQAINSYNAGEAAWEDIIKAKDEVVKDYHFLKDKVDNLFAPLYEKRSKETLDDVQNALHYDFSDEDPHYGEREAGRIHPPRDHDNRKKPVPFNSDLSPISVASNPEIQIGKELNLEHENPISVTNLPTSTNMSDNHNGIKGNVKETPVTKAQATYGLQNTHTTIIPYNTCMYAGGFGIGGYFNFSAGQYNQPGIRLDIPMTAPGLRIRNTFANNSVSGFATTIPNNFISNAGVSPNNALGFGTVFLQSEAYPANYIDTQTGLNITTSVSRIANLRNKEPAEAARPFFLEHFKEDYEYYTVTGCEYDIRIEALGSKIGDDILVGETFSGSRKPPMINKITVAGQTKTEYVTVQNALGWKHVKWHRMNGSAHRNVINIRGVYHPGDLRREVIDDDKVKTWYTTQPFVNPSQIEDLTLMFFKHPQTTTAYTEGAICNIYIQLKYIVQFKDLHQYKRYITGLYYLPPTENQETQNASEADTTALTDEVAGMDGDLDSNMAEI